MIGKQQETKQELAKQLGISRASLYYVSKQLPKDWELKRKIEEVLAQHPAYGYRRAAIALQINKKRIQRVMRLFGMRAYRRRGRKYRKIKRKTSRAYPNLLKETIPLHPNHIWAADFTYLPYQEKFFYLATVMDCFTREIVGWALMNNHSVPLILQALFVALNSHSRPRIFHSDNGREYGSKAFISVLEELTIQISRSAPGCPWQNGYQESFYSQFKMDLGDTNRFKTLGELAYAVYRTVWEYNHSRIHSSLKMPPLLFAERYQKLLEKMS